MQASDWTTHNIGGLIIPKSSSFNGLVILYLDIIASIIAAFFFYYAFKKPKRTKWFFTNKIVNVLNIF